jgi:IS30 family transposase
MRHGRATKEARGTERHGMPDAVSIRERPAEAEDRAVPGHWEGDLIAGTQSSYIATVVERATRFTMLVKVSSKKTEVVIDALAHQMRQLPAELRKSLTLDRGPEFAQHARFTLATDMKVYFCDPQSPWQRGSNENTNRLLRQYFPKGQDVSHYTQAQLNKVARELNSRPRMTLNYRTPAYRLNEALR